MTDTSSRCRVHSALYLLIALHYDGNDFLFP